VLTPLTISKLRVFGGILTTAALLFLMLFSLFADSPIPCTNGTICLTLSDLNAIVCDPGVQWLVFLCLVAYVLSFLVIRCQVERLPFWHATNSSLWLIALLSVGTFAYGFDYSEAAQSTRALMLLGGATLGVGATLKAIWREQGARTASVDCLIIIVLAAALVAASLWYPEWSPTFAFRGYARWTGPWDNPNAYGLLMGVGVVLAVGCAVANYEKVTADKSEIGSSKELGMRWKCVVAVLCLASVVVIGRGLVHSYSRGAWCGTIVGLSYLGTQRIRDHGSEFRRWIRVNVLSLAVTVASVLALISWHYRSTEWYPARRAFSVNSTVDSTWHDRVLSWDCALQITAEHPFLGAGWNQPERFWEQYYFPTGIPVGAVIGLNDYLLLGATLGIPALLCFAMYIWLCLRNAPQELQVANCLPDPPLPILTSTVPTLEVLQAICRAGAIVLLVGFWFNGGLFRLPTAATFWILIELGRRDLTVGNAK
jgi:O-antigen ligase